MTTLNVRAGARRLVRVGRPLPRALGHGERIELVEHLDELRSRLIVSLATLVAAFAVAFVEHDRILGWLNRSLPDSVGQPITIGVAEPFMTSVKVSLFAAFAVALPVLLWQAWRFVAPAFGHGARRQALAFVTASSVLFAAGGAFAYFVALPRAIAFLVGFDSELYRTEVRAQDFYVFTSATLLAVGLVFQLPVVLLALVRVGVLSAAKLRHNRRIGYLTLTVIAVCMPGVDLVLTTMYLLPLAALFEATLLLAGVLERRWRPDSATDG